MVAWLSNLLNRSVTARAMMLGAAVVVAFAATAPVAMRVGGVLALAAAAMAAVLCLVGAVAALVIVDRFRTPSGVLVALWVGMTIRTGIPFAVGVAIHLHGGPLAQAGLLCYLLVFYPIALAVGTVLSLPPRNRQQTPAL
jgi:hypothetical protein